MVSLAVVSPDGTGPDRTLAGGGRAGPAHGETGITCQEIFEGLPDHVEQGDTLIALRQWHDSSLRDLCFGELFSLWRTSATRILASAVCRRFGVPSPDIEALRKRVTEPAHYR